MIGNFLNRILGRIKTAIDIREVFFIGGLGMIFYGLWLYIPWVAFAVCGVLLLSMGIIMGPKK